MKTFAKPAFTNQPAEFPSAQMMLIAEAYGLDTAPMEGFDPEGVKQEFGLPDEAEVIALLAIGFAKKPDKSYGGRLALEHVVHWERFGWASSIQPLESAEDDPERELVTAAAGPQPSR